MSDLRATFNPLEKVWSGPKKTLLFNPECSVGYVIYTCLSRQHPDNVIQINDSEQSTLTAKEVLSNSINVAQNLLNMKLQQTDVIGIMAQNTTNLIQLCYGIIFTGIPFHAIDCEVRKETAIRMWGITEPKVIFCSGSTLDTVKEIVEELGLKSEIYTLNEHREGERSFDDLLQGLPDKLIFSPPEISNSDQTAAISNSSGSTGLPKAVTLSHKVILNTLSNLTETPSDTNLIIFSLFWECGILDYLVPAVTGCTNIVSNRSVKGEDIVELIHKYKVTGIIVMPVFVAQMLHSSSIEKCSMHSLEWVYSIGAKLPSRLRRRLEKYVSTGCVIKDFYGCSERGSIIGEISEGKMIPFFNTDVKIIDEFGNSLGPNERGQICVRKRIPWSGYYKDSAATIACYDHKEDWFMSGDMGLFDEFGYFHFVERIKDIIRLELFDISPIELEDIILRVPDVSQTCVFGIPDDLNFHILGALVLKKENSLITEADIKSFVLKNAPDYMQLNAGVYFVDKFPLTSTGKLIRSEANRIGTELYQKLQI